MATQSKAKTPARKPTWQEKLDEGKHLTALEETKADADFNYRFRLKEAEEREAFEQLKSRGRVKEDIKTLTELDQEDADDDGEGGDK